MAPAKRVKRCYISTSKFTTINAFFVNVNKSSIPAIVPEQSESASFVTLVEIHNVDVPAACNRNATVLSPTAGTLQWPSVIAVDFEIKSDSGSDSYTQRACRLFSRGGQKILLSDFNQKSLHISKCLLSMNNNDIIVYN